MQDNRPATSGDDAVSAQTSQTSPETAADESSTGGHRQILIGLVVGAGFGLAANAIAAQAGDSTLGTAIGYAVAVAEPVGKIFLRLMFMVVLPLVFSALTLSVVEIGDVRKLGRLGLKTLGLTAVLSSAAVLLGMGLVNLIEPGKSLPEVSRAALLKEYGTVADEKSAQARRAKSFKDTLLDIIPENPLQEMVGAIDGSSKGNGMLSVMFFALAFGVAITTLPNECATLVKCLEGVQAASMAVIAFAMRIAPVCAGCLVFVLTAKLGIDVVRTLGWFVVTVLLGLGLHLVVAYSAVIAVFSSFTPLQFFSRVREAMLVAFSTSSSSATLPTAIRVAEGPLGIPPRVARFVLIVGATGNQNGTALYEGIVVLFLAQVFGVELSLSQQLTVLLMSILAGVGTAGVPGGSLPLIVVVMTSVGVPAAGIGIILGVDRILDMARTVLNVTGDLAIAACVSGGATESEIPA